MKKVVLASILLFIIGVVILNYLKPNLLISVFSNQQNYYKLSDYKIIIKKSGTETFDKLRAHTLSIAELNKNGYRFWGYYCGYDGKNIRNDMGLAYSDDLINWTKDGDKPIIQNLRWGTVVVKDGIVHMFGTRNYGDDGYIVHLTSEDGKNFKEVQTVIPTLKGQKNQNPFIFFDDKTSEYRLLFYHGNGKDKYLKEVHSKDINNLDKQNQNIIMHAYDTVLAAPSMLYRDGKYWLTAETTKEIAGVEKWITIAYVSDNPLTGFKKVSNHNLLVDDDACFFPYVFDNILYGVYSHRYEDDTWDIYLRTHEFK